VQLLPALTPNQTRAIALAAAPTVALLTLNGLYLASALQTSVSLFWALDLLQFLVVPGASVWALWRVGVRPADYGLGPLATRPRDLVAYALVAAVFCIVNGAASAASPYVALAWGSGESLYPYAVPVEPNLAIIALLYFCLSAAFVEEIVFRGLLRLALPPRLFVPVSGLAFALIHWENGSWQTAVMLVLGFALAFLYSRIRNLWPFVFGHALTDMLDFAGFFAF
jgi:membrane protease YdiL (CAAX protease family)